MNFDILQSSKNITDKYIRYLKTMFDIDDPEYKALLEKKMTEMGSFSKGPYLDVIDSFETGASVEELISKGILHSDFRNIDKIRNLTLYKHQEEAIRKLIGGRNIVVSTGTGSGKTESFLIPILDSLMKERKEGRSVTPGVRALLIYPMNALANDQVDRLRKALAKYPYISFGSYTGQTLERESDALEKYKSLNGGKKPLKNELISREKMKATPPNILITNYSMLEYLMLRPEDNAFFQGRHADKWKYIVLDEAHTYSGSTGIEVSMLLRRVKACLPVKNRINFVLTSATLGDKDTDIEVAEFAERLCGESFFSEDVIRAYRVKLSPAESDSIALTPADYCELSDILDSGYPEEEICRMLSEQTGFSADTDDPYEYLFDLLRKDTTFWRIKNYLFEPKTVKSLCLMLGWKDNEVSSFVNVASQATRQGTKLFDSRYHLFIRATDGVFVTLGNHKNLSLTRRSYTDDGKDRFFEIATCSQCHAIYLLGRIEGDYLVQKSNLGGDNIKEAFLIGEKQKGEDEDTFAEDEKLDVNYYELCPHCGFIRPKFAVHQSCCDHSESEYITLTRVKQSERTGRVTKCYNCDYVNYTGVLRSFFSGQEASTSVIGTALFEELPDKVAQISDIHISQEISDDGFDDGFEDNNIGLEYTSKAKQFIAFSDNRQAAAFFATYFYETYQGFLYSRIVYDNVKELPIYGEPMTVFVRNMSSEFRERHVAEMFDQHPDYLKEAWKAMMKELINAYSRNSLIGLGLMKVDIDDDIKVSGNSKYGLTKEEVRDICMICIRTMLEDNAIHHGQNFTDADLAFFSNNGHISSYTLANPQNKYIRSFVPKTDSTTNKRLDYIERVFAKRGLSVNRDDLIKFMSGIWSRFFESTGLLKDNADYNGKRIDISKLRVSGGTQWYRCTKCRRLTAYNVSDVCPAYKCDGELEPVNVMDLVKDNHYFRIYNELDVRPMRVVEHTAQLSNEKAYELQDKFKRKEIDVLSCSTTFEMGVDIGELETVFMRNMPPAPSNYVQRAGRAGRSTKSAALALTFCNKSNHDFSYFENPVSMINGKIRPPLFKVENEKIGIRHLYASAFSYFWKQYPYYFGPISLFFGNEKAGNGYSDFKKYLESKPKDLLVFLKKAFPDQLCEKFHIDSFGWVGWLFDSPDSSYPNLATVFDLYRYEVDLLYKEKEDIEKSNKSNSSVVYRINTYTRENVISFLSRSNILPKYGFPVDTVDLQVSAERGSAPLGIELSRDLSMAISEYAPGCEVVAAGNLVRSRFIKKVQNKAWREYDFARCEKCGTLNIAIHLGTREEQSISECRQCNEQISAAAIDTFLIPEFGFSAEPKILKPSLIKPERTYRSEASLVNSGNTVYNDEYQIGGLTVGITCMEDGEIAVLNNAHFYVCPNCGYSLGDFEANTYTDTLAKEHHNPSGRICGNKKLIRRALGYRFKTDANQISLSIPMSFNEAYSVLQALILSACNILSIDNGEIDGCLLFTVKDMISSFDFILYDSTPGGAGHVKRLRSETTIREVLRGAYKKAADCDCGGAEGDASCYKCLRTYNNQHYHDEIKRKYVIDVLSSVIND